MQAEKTSRRLRRVNEPSSLGGLQEAHDHPKPHQPYVEGNVKKKKLIVQMTLSKLVNAIVY
ncbi:hypothetical protein ACVB78_20625 [Priestia aryabhattai]